jgi:protein-disulfide isomerase
VTEPEQPPSPSTPAPSRTAVSPGLVLAASLVALVFAVATWLLSSRQIGELRSELASLQGAHRELASQVMQGRRGGGAGPAGQTIDIAGAPAQGSPTARVALVEFSDYECPFCIRHFTQTMPKIEENYIRTGKVRYVFRDFPIDQNHPQAIKAHEAAHCAQEQGKFWEMHRLLFTPAGTHTPIALEDRAKEAGLDAAAYRACAASGRMTDQVRETVRTVSSMGATGTPWFFVGIRNPGTEKVQILRPVGGAAPYEQFAAALDAALKEVESAPAPKSKDGAK